MSLSKIGEDHPFRDTGLLGNLVRLLDGLDLVGACDAVLDIPLIEILVAHISLSDVPSAIYAAIKNCWDRGPLFGKEYRVHCIALVQVDPSISSLAYRMRKPTRHDGPR